MVIGLAACSSAPAATEAATTAAATTAAPAATTAAATTAAAEAAPREPISVTYFCNVGAYRDLLQREINKFNEGEGREKGVYIDFQGTINTYSQDLTALLEAGTHFELYDAGGHDDWLEKGWVVPDLYALNNAELTALCDSYAPYFSGRNYSPGGTVFSLPLEVRTIKMACNLDLFEKFNLELPRTWDDVYNAAKVITEGSNGEAFGFGWSTWTGMYSRLINQGITGSIGKYYWDSETESYDFGIYRDIYEKYVLPMYENGYMIGADDLAIDPIRAQFSEGVVGMFPAVSYDYAVFTNQFPAKCNWTIVEYPTLTEGEKPYKEMYLNTAGCSIDQVAYDAADDAKKQAIIDAFIFLNSDYLNGTIYSEAGMIPYKADLIANTKVIDGVGPQWPLFAQGLENMIGEPDVPDSLLPIEGDKFTTCFQNYLHGGYASYDELAADLNERYNAAYREFKEDGDISNAKYLKPVSFEK